MLDYSAVYGYVNIFDLVFNGGEGCEITGYTSDEYITVTKKYDRPRGRFLYEYFHRGVYLGGEWDKVSSGTLDDILQGLKGKGVFQSWGISTGAEYRPFSPRDEKKIKRLGLWVF